MPTWEESSPLVWDVERLRIATDAAGVALWSWNVDTDEIALDDRAHVLWGVARRHTVTFEELSANIHPEDLDRVRSAFEATRQVLGLYEIDFRILSGDDLHWVSARGRGDDMGIVGRIMFGVFLDVTERKRAEEARELIAAEMSHRVKNLLAISSAMAAIAARSAATPADMAQDLTRRLIALGRAHDLVRPSAGQPGAGKTILDDLLSVLLEPYAQRDISKCRIHISVPSIAVGETAVTTLALIIHELATNSIKYGALSASQGELLISAKDDGDQVVVIWQEKGGPSVIPPIGQTGFGTKLINQSLSGQLGGIMSSDWDESGLIAKLSMEKARLAA